MKILVVSEAQSIRLATKKVIETLLGDTVIVATHEQALATFLTEEPEAVLIFDYEEKILGTKGVGTYRDIKGSAVQQVVLRCGFADHSFDDYLQLPFLLPELFLKLKTERR